MKNAKEILSSANIDRVGSKSLIDFDKSLTSEFFLGDTRTIARELLGKLFVKKSTSGQYIASEIIETEAYLPSGDESSHSYRGRTPRNAAMFGPGGTLYVYLIYGMHHCFNLVTEPSGTGAAVLIRAGLPVSGIEEMMTNRSKTDTKKLIDGPGKIAQAYEFTREDSGISICTSNLFVQEYKQYEDKDIQQTTRIGIKKSKDLELRFTINNRTPKGEKI